MTASWGGAGRILGKPAVDLLHPSTALHKEFVDKEIRFSISFLKGWTPRCSSNSAARIWP